MAVLLETTLGDVVIDLYTEERPRGEPRAPLASCRGRHLPSPLSLSLPSRRRRPLPARGCRCPRPGCFISGPWLEKFLRGAALLRYLLLAVRVAGACCH